MLNATQLLLPLDLPPVLSSERFYTSPSNQEAFAWIQRWPNWPQRCLALYGPPGGGKTHLGHVWQAHVQGHWLGQDIPHPKAPVDLVLAQPTLIIDDAHLFEDEVYLLHLYNSVQEHQGGILFLAPKPPAHWDIKLPDLHSRLKMIPAVQILPPDDALLLQVLQKRFADHQLYVEPEVLHFLLQHMERSFLAAQVLVQHLNEAALRFQKNLSLSFVREQCHQFSFFC